jgi:hypothetical protein
VPEDRHEASSILRAHSFFVTCESGCLLGACELVHVFVFDREKAAVIMLRMLADTVQARI